jgi:hypothetical protein
VGFFLALYLMHKLVVAASPTTKLRLGIATEGR